MHLPQPLHEPFNKPAPKQHDNLLDLLGRPRQKHPWEHDFDRWPLDSTKKEQEDAVSRLFKEAFKTPVLPSVPSFQFKDGIYKLELVLAGYKKANVSVEIVDDLLTLTATKGGLTGEEKHSFKVKLPVDADLRTGGVTLEEGILRISFLKREPQKQTLPIE
jgi:HSP20 family molecular chaperone IbpA